LSIVRTPFLELTLRHAQLDDRGLLFFSLSCEQEHRFTRGREADAAVLALELGIAAVADRSIAKSAI
jgi:hypothetical protein